MQNIIEIMSPRLIPPNVNVSGDMQSVHITINVVSSNPAQARFTRYHIMW
jgi:hypothetical protein